MRVTWRILMFALLLARVLGVKERDGLVATWVKRCLRVFFKHYMWLGETLLSQASRLSTSSFTPFACIVVHVYDIGRLLLPSLFLG